MQTEDAWQIATRAPSPTLFAGEFAEFSSRDCTAVE
jgi:hypothetical protein